MKKPASSDSAERREAQQLLEAVVGGDLSAREKLARWCLPRVRRTVGLTYGNGAEREDLVQIAMARVFDRIGTFRGEASFYVWVDRVTLNVVRDHFKRRRFVFLRRVEVAEEGGGLDGVVHDTPEAELDRRQLFERLAGHISAIKQSRRYPLVLSVLHGYSVPEIAALLDLSYDAAKKRLQRGRADLMSRLERDRVCRQAIRELKR
jgi:RNA polymerase sigma-70 factor (ECF subfamily)